MRIAVIGPGAIGGTVAGWLGENPSHQVTVCARTPFSGLEIVTPGRVLRSNPVVITDPRQGSPADWVLVATKAYDTAAAAAWFGTLVGPSTRVAILQNGVEHVERFSAYVDAASIVPVIVQFSASKEAPGRIVQGDRAKMQVAYGEAGEQFVNLFEGTDIDAQTTDWKTAAWRKLCINAPGAVSALVLASGTLGLASVEDLLRGLTLETLKVGRAEGAVLEDALVETLMEMRRNEPPTFVNSLHADRMARRPMEWDARNGVVVRCGRRHGIPTPLNEMAVALLQAIEKGYPAG